MQSGKVFLENFFDHFPNLNVKQFLSFLQHCDSGENKLECLLAAGFIQASSIICEHG
jgi:hypothetical protein